MLVTVTNVSGRTINKLDSYEAGSGPSAVKAIGGQKKDALPYPFGHIGELAAAGTKQLPMHPQDLAKKAVEVGSPMTAGEEWNQLVQGGIVTLTIADQTDVVDTTEKFMLEV